MKFQIGDIVRANNDVIDIWIKPGKEYTVLDYITYPPEPGSICYRNCGHPMHDPKPARHCIVIDGEKPGMDGNKCHIWDGCFSLVKSNT